MSTPAACREGDALNTGHSCTATTTLDIPGQSKVRINGKLAARKGDSTVPHTVTLPFCPIHTAVVNVGSSTVRIHGKKAARVGDSTDDGAMTSGSGNVNIGG
jgi:uncharacterized Zn-binding protein involved in type VI secretion